MRRSKCPGRDMMILKFSQVLWSWAMKSFENKQYRFKIYSKRNCEPVQWYQSREHVVLFAFASKKMVYDGGDILSSLCVWKESEMCRPSFHFFSMVVISDKGLNPVLKSGFFNCTAVLEMAVKSAGDDIDTNSFLMCFLYTKASLCKGAFYSITVHFSTSQRAEQNSTIWLNWVKCLDPDLIWLDTVYYLNRW